MTATTKHIRLDVLQPPELDHDRMMLAKYQHKVSANGRLERRIAWNLFAHLANAGWTPCELNDGDRKTRVADAKATMELLFNLDDAYVTMTDGKREHWIRFVLGNGTDIISDYSYNEQSSFYKAIEAFDPEVYA